MGRLLVLILVVALSAVIVATAAAAWRAVGAATRDRSDPAETRRHPMQRLSYVLLLALILYAALWGGG